MTLMQIHEIQPWLSLSVHCLYNKQVEQGGTNGKSYVKAKMHKNLKLNPFLLSQINNLEKRELKHILYSAHIDAQGLHRAVNFICHIDYNMFLPPSLDRNSLVMRRSFYIQANITMCLPCHLSCGLHQYKLSFWHLNQIICCYLIF